MGPQGLNLREPVPYYGLQGPRMSTLSTPGSHCAPDSPCSFDFISLFLFFLVMGPFYIPSPLPCIFSSFWSLNPVYSSIMNFNVNSLGMLSQTCLSCISTSPSPGFKAMLFFVFLNTVIIWHLFVWSLGYVCFASGLWAPWGQEAHLLLHSVPNIWNVVGAQGLLIG